VQIGKLKDLITIQRFVVSGPADAYGQTPGAWTDYAKVWGQVIPQTGDEPIVNDGPKAKVQYRVLIRYRTDLTGAFRLIFRGVPLAISAVFDPDQRRRELVLLCHHHEDVS